jgi:peptidylprolyl isomerase
MKLLRNLFICLLLIGAVTQMAPGKSWADDNTMVLELKDGKVVIQLEPNLAPKTVAHIKELVQKGFYDNTPIHRVIPGFMAQMGDPTGTGTGGSGKTVPAEFTNTPFQRGTVGLARSSDPDSGDSQFFICFAPADFLNGQYTVFGQVTSGMEVVDKIKAGTEENNGAVDNPDHIIKARLGQ